MPVDEYGVRADIVINPQAVPNRMSPSQIYHTGINRMTLFVQKQAIEKYKNGDALGAVNHILEYIRDLNPQYEELCVREKLLHNPEATMEYIVRQDEKEELGIFIMIPGFLKQINPENINRIRKKFNVKISPVTYTITDAITGVKKTVTTKTAVCISSKYNYLLYNIPQAKAPGVGHINQFKIPVKPNSKARNKSPIGETPLRMGEDEDRIMTMCAGPDAVTRLMGLHANSFEAVTMACEIILDHSNPAKIDRFPISNDEIRRTNNVVGVANHMMATMGIDMTNVNCEVFDEVKFKADLDS